MSRVVQEQGTATAVPSGYSSANSSYSSVNSSYPISNGYAGSDSTSYAYITCNTGSRASSYISYTFDVDIPDGATITSVTCKAKARVSSTNYLTTAVHQLYAGSTAKGSTTSYCSTTASARDVDGGSSWTLAEARNVQLRSTATRGTSNTSRAAYIRFYGADMTVAYTVSGTEYELTVTNSTSATVTSDQWVKQGADTTVLLDDLDGIVVNGTDVTSQFVQRTETDASYDVVNVGSYGFALNSSTGYYVSNNKGVSKSAAVCRIDFHLPVSADITFTYINYAEQGYDFCVFGNVDVSLSNSYYAAGSSGAAITDSSYKKACNTSSDNTSSAKTLTYSDVPSGDHSIWVKYSKDDASDANNDTLQFKLAITLNEPFAPGTYWAYDITNVQADHAIVVTSASTTALYVKQNGSWVQVSKAYRKVSGSWQEVALDQAFQSGVNYKLE